MFKTPPRRTNLSIKQRIQDKRCVRIAVRLLRGSRDKLNTEGSIVGLRDDELVARRGHAPQRLADFDRTASQVSAFTTSAILSLEILAFMTESADHLYSVKMIV
jgi:hypothetical protein